MKRFEKVFSQGTMDVVEIWVDTETGVNYLWLLDESGKPVVTKH